MFVQMSTCYTHNRVQVMRVDIYLEATAANATVVFGVNCKLFDDIYTSQFAR